MPDERRCLGDRARPRRLPMRVALFHTKAAARLHPGDDRRSWFYSFCGPCAALSSRSLTKAIPIRTCRLTASNGFGSDNLSAAHCRIFEFAVSIRLRANRRIRALVSSVRVRCGCCNRNGDPRQLVCLAQYSGVKQHRRDALSCQDRVRRRYTSLKVIVQKTFRIKPAGDRRAWTKTRQLRSCMYPIYWMLEITIASRIEGRVFAATMRCTSGVPARVWFMLRSARVPRMSLSPSVGPK